ncbi:MAG: Rab family GTPase [Candidatus Hodarchaeota archaeon]
MLDRIIKIVISGDGGVGKTTLLNRYVNEQFEIDTQITKGLEFFSKKIVIERENYQLLLWDLGGQEQFKALFSKVNWLEGTIGALVLFDLTRFSTLTQIDFWLSLLSQYGDFPTLIIGSKYDMINGNTREIDDSVSKILEKSDNCFSYLKTSSFTGKNVNETFELLAKKVVSNFSSCD